METNLLYGIREGKIVHISEIDEEHNGKKCNCICPDCGGTLIARIGHGERKPHFAHEKKTDCNPVHAQQTGIHLLAKSILAENREILMPGWSISREDIIPAEGDPSICSSVEIELPAVSPVVCRYDSVELEKGKSNIIADSMLTIKGRECAVEIAVTHFVDDVKREKTEKLGLPMFEINLSGMVEETDRDRIVRDVLYCPENRMWIFNPKQAAVLEAKRTEFQQKLEKLIREKNEKEKKRRAWREQKEKQLKEAFLPENYAEIIKNLRNDREALAQLKQFGFSSGIEDYPFYLDIPITGEFVFACDRRIWQGKLFEEFFYKGFGDDEHLSFFTLGELRERLLKEEYIRYDKSKTLPATVTLDGVDRHVSLSYDVIRKFMEYMELLGFAAKRGNQLFSRKIRILKPPRRKEAEALEKVLASVDPGAPDVDSVIGKALEKRLDEKKDPLP